MLNLIGKILILITIIGVLSFGLVTVVNNSSTGSSFQEGESSQRFQPDQTGSSAQTGTFRPEEREGGFDGERGGGSFVEIGKSLGVFALITLVVTLIQKGIRKLPHRKPAVSE
jgi:hypothetical protein